MKRDDGGSHTEIAVRERAAGFAYSTRVSPMFNKREGVNESQSCSCARLSRQPITSIHYHIGLLCARQFFLFFLFLSLSLSLSLVPVIFLN